MSRLCIQADWDDAPHLTARQKSDLFASIPEYQRGARTKGVPQLGSGAIYPVLEEDILCDPFELPAWYRHAYALDVGWNRTAALWGALDPEEDVLYLWSEHYRGHAEPIVHAGAIRARGDWIPGVVDPAARGRQQADGQKLFDLYMAEKLLLSLADHSVEAGILDVWQRMSTGRLRVFRTLQNFRSEFRIYRRDEKGKIVKENDHLMDCCRYLVRSGLAVAKQRPWEKMGERAKPAPQPYNPFAELDRQRPVERPYNPFNTV